MAEIIAFPNVGERDWREIERALRESYKDVPDGLATLEECLEKIRSHWKDIFVSFTVSPTYQIPGSLSQEQLDAIQDAVTLGVNLVVEKLKAERLRLFGKLVTAEYVAAFARRHGRDYS